MAPSSIIAAAPPTAGSLVLPDDDLYELRQCERIVQFRDAIFAGSHPRIKIPQHLVGKLTTTGIMPTSSPSGLTSRASVATGPVPADQRKVENSLSFNVNQQRLPLSAPSQVPTAKGFEFDPTLAIQSTTNGADGEILLRRQWLEEVLRNQSEQHRAGSRADAHGDLDIADILERATELAKTFAPPIVATTTATHNTPSTAASVLGAGATAVAAANPTTDSTTLPARPMNQGHDADGVGQAASPMDDETFYSSQDESSFEVARHPVTSSPAAIKNSSNGTHAKGDASKPRSDDAVARVPGIMAVPKQAANTGSAQGSTFSSPMDPQAFRRIGNGHLDRNVGATTGQNIQPQTQSPYSPSHMQPQTRAKAKAQSKAQQRFQGSARPFGFHNPTSQPAPFSPSSFGGGGGYSVRSGPGAVAAAPAQVVSLRNEQPAAASSPDSSPQGLRAFDRKKGKKKNKRKADRQVVEAEGSTYIKSEPESPPLAMVPLHRPHKRQKHTDRPEPIDNRVAEHRPTHAPAHAAYHEQYQVQRDDRVQMPPPLNRTGTFAMGEMEQRDYPRDYATDPYSYRQMPSPGSFATYSHPHAPLHSQPPLQPVMPSPTTNSYSGMTHPSQYSVEPYHADMRHFAPQEQHYDPGRVSVRPSGGARSPIVLYEAHSPAAMPPPRAPPPRIVMYGREYVEHVAPEPAPTGRNHAAVSVAPSGDSSMVYERGTFGPGQVTRRPGYAEAYGEMGAAYSHGLHGPQGLHQPPTSTYLVPRRAVAQPDGFAPVESRPYGQREYSVRPMAPPGTDEYADPQRFPDHVDRRPMDGHYLARSASVRPAEPTQYEAREYERQPSQYGGGSWVREYRPSAPAEDPLRAPAYPLSREYSVRPAETRPAVLREPSARPADAYYDEQPHVHDGRSHAESAAFRRPGMSREPHR